MENAYDMPANVTLPHLLEGACAAPITQHEVVSPVSRRTFLVNAVPGLENTALSTAITSDLPVVVERAMYMNGSSRLWKGGTAGRGATELSTSWALAEGATGFFHTYLLIGNPNAGEASVTVRYQLSDGTTIEKSYGVAASRGERSTSRANMRSWPPRRSA